MKILIHSNFGDSAGLAWLMQKEGAQVWLYIKDNYARKVMEGIVPHVETLEEGLRQKPDFILFDLTGHGKLAESLRKDGFRVLGGSDLADRLELDRSYGAKVAKQYGIACPETVEFKSVDEAIAYIKKVKKPLALKIDNNKSEASSYVSDDYQEMLDYIAYQKEDGLLNGDTFILQEKINGAEVSTECWFNSGVACLPSNSTWETKKFLAGELGVRTGCETSLVCHYEGDSSRLARETVLRLSPLLKYANYTGPMDVNAIVSEKDQKPYFLEFTPRLGYSAIYAYAHLLGMPLSEYLHRMAVSRERINVSFRAKWASSLRINIPPYPFTHEDKRVEKAAYDPSENIRVSWESKDFVPLDIKKGKRGDMVTAGTSGIIGECLGRGNSVMEAWRASQKVFEDVEVPNKGGRLTDGVEDAWKRILKLRSWGYTEIPTPSQGQGPSSQLISPGSKRSNPFSAAVKGG